MKMPHEIEPIFAIQITGPDHFENLKATSNALLVETRRESRISQVYANVTRAMFFVDLDRAGQWLIQLRSDDVDAMLDCLKAFHLEEIFLYAMPLKMAA